MRATILTENGNLVHRSSPDVLFTIFFSMLSFLHAVVVVTGVINGRWECYMSGGFCVVFAVVAVVCRKFRFEVALLKGERIVRLRHGVGKLYMERRVRFGAITDVRLTLLGSAGPEGSQIELLSPDDDIVYPPSRYPRQEALLLAMTLDVPLIKVYGENVAPDQERIPSTHL